MTILDRYIARQYLTNIVVLFVVLFAFVVAIDASWNIDRFLKTAAQYAAENQQEDSGLRRGLITVLLVMDLWWPRLLQLFNYMLGLVLVGAMGFTCAQLVRHRELVAVLASGLSLHRIARPILLVALGMLLLQTANQELILPQIAPLLTRDQNEAGKRDLGVLSTKLRHDGAGNLFYARRFDADHEVCDDLYFWERDSSGLANRRIYAPKATWNKEAGGWDLQGGIAEARAVGDAKAPQPVARILTDLDPTSLKMYRYSGYSQNLSSAQLAQLAVRIGPGDPVRHDRIERIRWGRFAVMGTNILALIISMRFFLTREPRNMVVQSLWCAPVAIVALLGGVLLASWAVPGVPAALGVFIPAMILLPIAVATATSVRT
jgi:lipopolysaccharide export system permease protein